MRLILISIKTEKPNVETKNIKKIMQHILRSMIYYTNQY